MITVKSHIRIKKGKKSIVRSYKRKDKSSPKNSYMGQFYDSRFQRKNMNDGYLAFKDCLDVTSKSIM